MHLSASGAVPVGKIAMKHVQRGHKHQLLPTTTPYATIGGLTHPHHSPQDQFNSQKSKRAAAWVLPAQCHT